MLLSFAHVSHLFSRSQGVLGLPEQYHAVRDVSFGLQAGETLGLVGESGCGKSTIAKIAVGLLPPTYGQVTIMGQPLYDKGAHTDYAAFRRSVCQNIQMIFQDPYSSLNPRLRILASVMEPLLCLQPHMQRAEHERKAIAMLERVGIAKEQATKFPHEFSGGQRQRIAVARALITNPALVICDEPTSSLDSSVQAQVLNLLLDMQQELGVAYLFISHDLGVVRHMSDRVMVMYAGSMVEEAPAMTLFDAPLHPYSQLLLAVDPFTADESQGCRALTDNCMKAAQNGVMPLGEKNLSGCVYAASCGQVRPRCVEQEPTFVSVDEKSSHRVRCFACM